MEGLLITHKGMEDISALEVKDIIGKNPKINESCIIFNINKFEELIELCYKSQSAIGIYYLLHEFKYKDMFKDLKNNLEKLKLNDWLSKNVQFKVQCLKNYNSDFSTPELEEKFGEIIIDHIDKKYHYKQKVNLEDPDIIIFIYLIETKFYIGIDFAGFDLSKRSYKISSNSADIKGTIAYFLVRLSEFNKNETLLDCFSGSGTIPIEAAIFASKFPLNYFNKEKFIFTKIEKFKKLDFNKIFKKIDNNILHEKLKIFNMDPSMKYLNYAKKNCKIAGIGKILKFSRFDLEWLDTKFDKNKIDKLITRLPSTKQKDIENTYNEFFYQSEFILNKKGKMVVIGDKELTKKYSSKYKFKISDERTVYLGEMKYDIFVLIKK